MIIDLRTIMHVPRHFNFTFQKDWWQGDEEKDQILGLDEPLKVRVSIYRAGSRYVLEGDLSGLLLLTCDRCLEPFRHNLASDFRLFLALLSSDTDQGDLELFEDDLQVDFIAGDEIDLDDVVRAQVYLSLPVKFLCMEECLGLCPLCGTNLNTEECKCRHEKG